MLASEWPANDLASLQRAYEDTVAAHASLHLSRAADHVQQAASRAAETAGDEEGQDAVLEQLLDAEREFAVAKDHFKRLKFHFLEVAAKERFVQQLFSIEDGLEAGPTPEEMREMEQSVRTQKNDLRTQRQSLRSMQTNVTALLSRLCQEREVLQGKALQAHQLLTQLAEMESELKRLFDEPLLKLRSIQEAQAESDELTRALQENTMGLDQLREGTSQLRVQLRDAEDLTLQRDRERSQLQQQLIQVQQQPRDQTAQVQDETYKWFTQAHALLEDMSGIELVSRDAHQIVLIYTLDDLRLFKITLYFDEDKFKHAEVDVCTYPLEDIISLGVERQDLPWLVHELTRRLAHYAQRDDEWQKMPSLIEQVKEITPIGDDVYITLNDLRLVWCLERDYPTLGIQMCRLESIESLTPNDSKLAPLLERMQRDMAAAVDGDKRFNTVTRSIQYLLSLLK